MNQSEVSLECMCGICKLNKREWVGLTEKEIKSLPQWFPSHETAAVMPLIYAIEAKLKEKNE